MYHFDGYPQNTDVCIVPTPNSDRLLTILLYELFKLLISLSLSLLSLSISLHYPISRSLFIVSIMAETGITADKVAAAVLSVHAVILWGFIALANYALYRLLNASGSDARESMILEFRITRRPKTD
jgi:hypothetical protein